jgi:hypothetical protein
VIPAPDHLAESGPQRHAPDEGSFGAFRPSNIMERDGAYHAFFEVQSCPLGDQHVCLMRTETQGDPDSWRYRTSAAFEGRFADPYRDDLSVPQVDRP